LNGGGRNEEVVVDVNIDEWHVTSRKFVLTLIRVDRLDKDGSTIHSKLLCELVVQLSVTNLELIFKPSL
jgi:hypothetical protein